LGDQVCAPTGAGKTNIAMITVLHEIGQHLKYGVLQKDEFKIVYVAPMKVPSSSPPFAPYSNCILRGLTDDLIHRLQSQLA
jgi:hypothetical protein